MRPFSSSSTLACATVHLSSSHAERYSLWASYSAGCFLAPSLRLASSASCRRKTSPTLKSASPGLTRRARAAPYSSPICWPPTTLGAFTGRFSSNPSQQRCADYRRESVSILWRRVRSSFAAGEHSLQSANRVQRQQQEFRDINRFALQIGRAHV